MHIKDIKVLGVVYNGKLSLLERCVGGDRDVHGCIASAGYVYNDTTKQCERPWEMKK